MRSGRGFLQVCTVRSASGPSGLEPSCISRAVRRVSVRAVSVNHRKFSIGDTEVSGDPEVLENSGHPVSSHGSGQC